MSLTPSILTLQQLFILSTFANLRGEYRISIAVLLSGRRQKNLPFAAQCVMSSQTFQEKATELLLGSTYAEV